MFPNLESPVKPPPKVESSKDKKRKSPDDQDLFGDDDDFESLMQDIDFDEEMGTLRFRKLVVELKLVGLKKTYTNVKQ